MSEGGRLRDLSAVIPAKAGIQRLIEMATGEFKEEAEASVSGPSLKASARKTRFRAAAGTVHVWGEGRHAP